MSGGFCGIDPAALGELVLRLEWAATDIDTQAGRAYERLTRHSRWSQADGVGPNLSGIARWARISGDDMRGRLAAMIAAQNVVTAGTPPTSGGWHPVPGPVPWPGPYLPGFPLGPPDSPPTEAGLPWEEIEEWVRGALGVWNGRVDDTFPLGRWIFGNLWMNRVRQYLAGTNPIIAGELLTPTIANGFGSRHLANTRYFQWVNNPGVQALGRRASIGLSLASAVGDGVVIWNQGHPVDAFEREGAGYVADWARFGFSTSTTVFLMAPTPVTGAIVIAAGVVWVGAEVVDHWDEITEFWGDVYDDVEQASQWMYRESNELITDAWDWSHRTWDETTAWVGNRLEDAHDWAGDRVEDLTDIGDELVDAGATFLEGAADFGKKVLGFDF